MDIDSASSTKSPWGHQAMQQSFGQGGVYNNTNNMMTTTNTNTHTMGFFQNNNMYGQDDPSESLNDLNNDGDQALDDNGGGRGRR